MYLQKKKQTENNNRTPFTNNREIKNEQFIKKHKTN